MSETKLANRINSATRCLRKLEDVLTEQLDTKQIHLDATVHRFNITFETVMKALDAYLEEVLDIPQEHRLGPYHLLQVAYQKNLISDEQVWLAIRKGRNATSHEYDEQQSLAFYHAIAAYTPYLRALLDAISNG